jgi:thiol:disulfide interchange protein DsbG
MVGVIREDSAAKAATLLADANPETALQKHEQAGQSSTLKAMSSIPKDIQAKLDANMKLMNDLGLSATPSIFYKDAAGHQQQQQGAPRPEVLAKMMGPK